MSVRPTRPRPLYLEVIPGGAAATSRGSAGATVVERTPVRARRSRLTLAVLAAAASTLAICLLSVQSGTSRLSTVPPAERAVLASRTLSNLTEICRGRERPRLFCQDQAELLLELPECGGACRTVARDALGADSAVK